MAVDTSPRVVEKLAGKDSVPKLRLVNSNAGRIGVAVFVILVVALPLNFGDTYWLGVLNSAGIAAIAAIGLNILTGYAGQLSLGHAAFVSIGAFVTQYVGGQLGLPMIVWLPVAGIAAALVGAAVAPFALRLHGPYLAIVSLAMVAIVIWIARNIPSITGGNEGTVVTAEATLGPINFEELTIGPLAFAREQGMFILIWAMVGLFVLITANVMRTRSGRAMQAVRDHDMAAEVLGVRMMRTQANAFVLSTFIAGVAGGLLAVNLEYIRPDSFSVHLSVEYLAIIVIGGLIQDQVTGGVEKVPGLGDIPGIGSLFRYDNRKRTKTNLMVFLRPYVVRDGGSNSNLMVDRYEYMRAQQAMAQPGSHWLLPDMQAPQLPPRIPGAGDPIPNGNAGAGHVPPTVVPRDIAALQADDPTLVLQVIGAPSEIEAQLAARRIADAGMNAYVVQNDPNRWDVRMRIARDRVTVDTTLAALRHLGYAAEIVTR